MRAGGQGQFWVPLTTDGPSAGRCCKKANWKRATAAGGEGAWKWRRPITPPGVEDGFVQWWEPAGWKAFTLQCDHQLPTSPPSWGPVIGVNTCGCIRFYHSCVLRFVCCFFGSFHKQHIKTSSCHPKLTSRNCETLSGWIWALTNILVAAADSSAGWLAKLILSCAALISPPLQTGLSSCVASVVQSRGAFKEIGTRPPKRKCRWAEFRIWDMSSYYHLTILSSRFLVSLVACPFGSFCILELASLWNA